LTVTARATVKRDGAAGETIPVENEASGARLMARIEPDGSLTVVGVAPRRRPR
jgi:flagella basal body P-ring formation protein FlgA